MVDSNAHILNMDSSNTAIQYLEKLGVSSEGIELMSPKCMHYCIKLQNIDKRAANILKQEMLSLGGEAALPWSVFKLSSDVCDLLLIGNQKHFSLLVNKLARQPFKLNSVGSQITEVLDNYKKDEFAFKARNKRLSLGKKTLIMGTVNVTHDSFSGDGIYDQPQKAIDYAMEMLEKGADIIDIGGESTRPGATIISAQEELKRVLPIIKSLRKKTSACISVDTYKHEVAKKALDEGVDIINDVTGTNYDVDMIPTVKEFDAGLIVMHTPNPPEEMHKPYHYQDLLSEMMTYFRKAIKNAKDAGIHANSIMIDPGIGFGKTIGQNFFILKNLGSFKSLGFPIVVGTSRKSFIGKTLNQPEDERLFGTCATVAIAIHNGAHMVRVHDIAAIKDVVKITDALINSKEQD